MQLRRFVIAVIFVLALLPFTTVIFAQTSVTTVTVKPQEDTTTVLQNPLMGFQDHDVARNWWPSSTVYMRSATGCLQNGKYYSCQALMWDRLNPQQGVYNFSDIDILLDNVKTQKRFAGIRLRTVVDASAVPAVPAWATTAGVTTSWGQEAFGGRSGVEIDYKKCVFLSAWGDLIQQLALRYDNNPQLSFIDVGGYGWYGEWWSGKTVLQRQLAYQILDKTDPTQQQSLDTRTRIIKMFVGGSGSGHCVNNSGQDTVVSYSYTGFKNKFILISRGDQEDVALGIANGTGIRYDAVGAANTDFRSSVATSVAQTWQNKPIMGEFVNASAAPRNSTFLTRSLCFVREYHLSAVHNNDSTKPTTVDMTPLYRELGYRIALNSASYPSAVSPSSQAAFTFTWLNKGTSPAYNRYPMTLYFKPKGVDSVSAKVQIYNTNITKILPAGVTASNSDYTSCTKGAPVPVVVNETVTIPALPTGSYDMYFGFTEPVYGNQIQLALTSKDTSGRYLLGQINVQNGVSAEPPQATNTPAPTFQPPTNTPSAPATTVALKTIEAQDVQIVRTGTWNSIHMTGPSGDSFIQSTGATTDTLTLSFTGSYLDVTFVVKSDLGKFNVVVDGQIVSQISETGSTTSFGHTYGKHDLSSGSHTVKIVPVTGAVAIDTFKVQQ